MSTRLALGKTPARPNAVTFKFSDFVDTTKLPPLKSKVGWPGHMPNPIGMLGNDQYGDCVWAGAAHETMLWNELGSGTDVAFTDQSVLSDYSAVTGFNPNDPNSDQGTDMQVAASYRRKTGIRGADGRRHQVGAYLALEPGNIHQMKYAIYLFNTVGIGIRFPASAMSQFNQGKSWSVVSGSPIEGGHYIPGVYADTRGFQVVTWGKIIRATNGFIEKYTDEAIAYVSLEALHNGTSFDGFAQADLLAALKALPTTS